MEIAPQITVSIKPELYQSVLNTNTFKPGSTLKLTVLELRGDRALIDFGNFRATADVKIPVTLGEELLVRVQELGRQLKLNLVNPKQIDAPSTDSTVPSAATHTAEAFKQIQSDLKPILNLALAPPSAPKIPIVILNALSALSAYFESFNLSKTVDEIAPRLKAYLENSGLFFEKLLESAVLQSSNDADVEPPQQMTGLAGLQVLANRDLKANLMVLKNFAEHEMSLTKIFDSRTLSALRGAVDGLLADIDQQQGRAVKALDTADPFQVFTYTLPLKDDNQTARLKIYYHRKQKSGSQKGFQISLLLSMDRLGDLRSDFYLLGKDLTITFFVKDRPTKTKLQENYFELRELLPPFFDQLILRTIVSKKKIKDFDREDIQITGDRRVDLRV